jgi:two-component system NtrC family sensor kinase
MRATLDPDKFYRFIRTIGQGKVADLVLINREGKYQIVDPATVNCSAESRRMPPASSALGKQLRQTGILDL